MSKAVSGVILTLYLTGMLASMLAVTSGDWVWVRDTVAGDYGEAVVGTGEAIYIARNISFYRYRPVDNNWVNLTSPPNPDAWDAFKTGTALAWDFGDYIYALYGAATNDNRRWFYRYSISQDSWEALANTPADQGEGDAMTWVGIENCIYATIGGEQRPTYFLRYDPSTNSWSDAPENPPEGMGDGASLVWTGGNFLYALRGEYFEKEPLYDFWRYSLVNNTWESMAEIPAYPHDEEGVGGVGDGGSLLYVGFWLQNQTNYIYALSGNQAFPEKEGIIPDHRFYRYTISIDCWKRLADLPFGIGYYVGCRLGYADGHIYAWQGTNSSWAGGGDDLARYEFPILLPPTADFSYSPISVVNETLTFDASASQDPDGFIISYTWDFGDNTPVAIEDDPVTTHIYGAIGTYNVTLTVTDDDGLTDSANANLTVVKHPVAHFTFSPENPLVGETVTFNASTSTPNGGYIANYTWDFGDDTPVITMTAPIITHVFDMSENYTITLTVMDSEGLTDTHSQSVTVRKPPLASFTYSPTIPLAGETVTFNASLSMPNGGHIVSYAWDFETDGAIDAYGMIVTHSYATYGTYSATLNVTDSEGLWGTETKSIAVLAPPIASFTYSPEFPLAGETVIFNASDSHDPDGYIVSYAWDFGDGLYDEGMITYHNYSEVGIYNVTLTITDDEELNDTAWATITVLTHDVTTVSVTPSTNEVYEGQIVNITVAVKNKGNFTETFNVTAYASHQILEFILTIDTQAVTDLSPGNQTTLTFSWNTTDVTLGNYTISAEARVIPGETYATDNVEVNGTVNVIPEFASTPLLFVIFAATTVVSMFMKRKQMIKNPRGKHS